MQPLWRPLPWTSDAGLGYASAAIPNWNGMFKRLYDWLIALSQSASAPYALAAVAFAESSFFPIPPDVILAPIRSPSRSSPGVFR